MNKTCKCGFDENHPTVTHKCNYNKWGWFLLTVLGMSAKPQSVEFICTNCSETISISTDASILAKFVGR